MAIECANAWNLRNSCRNNKPLSYPIISVPRSNPVVIVHPSRGKNTTTATQRTYNGINYFLIDKLSIMYASHVRSAGMYDYRFPRALKLTLF